jgi:transcription initiation factor TFIIIB Brf1 subunit/transcription initiation factor TFIIB
MEKKKITLCAHAQTIEDDHTGDYICTECGLVLDCVYSSTYSSHVNTPTAKNLKIKNFLQDVSANAHIPQCITLYAYNMVNKIEERKLQENKKCNLHHLAAYCLYETLQRFEVPRKPEEIEYFTGIEKKHFIEIEKSEVFHETYTQLRVDPTLHVEKYCKDLDLHYFDVNIIRSIVGNMYGMGSVSTNCLIAVVIHLFCKEMKRKITLKSICEKCCVSTASVHRIIREKVSKEYVNNISALASR